MKFIFGLFSFFLFFSCSCTEKFIAKDQFNEKIDCKPGEIKETQNEKFICVQVDANCNCNYYNCVQNGKECKILNRYSGDDRTCPFNAQCSWVSDCGWIIKCDPGIKECSSFNFETLFGKCWCRMQIVDKSCMGKTINQTLWIKLD